MIISLGCNAHGVGRGQAGNHQFPDLGRVLGSNSQAERHSKLVQQSLIGPHGVAPGNFGTLFVKALLLAPDKALHIIGKLGTVKCRRCGQALDQVGQLFNREIGLHLILRIQRHGRHDEGPCDNKILFHINN